MDFSVNLWAVLVGGIISMVLGALWYSPAMFAKKWAMLAGITDEKMKAAMAKGMGMAYLTAFISSLLMTYILAHFVEIGLRASGQVGTFGLGAQMGAWIWLGFIATSFTGMVLWEGKSWKLYFINAGYYLVSLVLIGGILGAWR